MSLASLLIRLGNEKFQKLFVIGLFLGKELLEFFRRVCREPGMVLFNKGPSELVSAYLLV